MRAGATTLVVFALGACDGADPPIRVTGDCKAVSSWSGHAGWVPTGPQGERFDQTINVTGGRPDCDSELSVSLRRDGLVPSGRVRVKAGLVTCGNAWPDGAWSVTATVTLSPGDPIAPVRFAMGPMAPCLTDRARAEAATLRLPFGSPRVLVTLHALTPIYDGLEIDTQWSYVDFATWDDPAPGDAGQPDAGHPLVELLDPLGEAIVESPVRFEVRAEGVARVRLEVAGSTLALAWDPSTTTVQSWPLSSRPPGPTEVDLFGLDANDQVIAGPEHVRFHLIERYRMLQTYYYMVYENDHPGGGTVALFDCGCEALTKVTGEVLPEVDYHFFRALCREGSGRLADDRTYVNVVRLRECPGATQCPAAGSSPAAGKCWKVITQRWGIGSRNNALIPFKSLATDGAFIAFGQGAYVPDWDGRAMPLWIDPADAAAVGGSVHDGCFVAHDVGSAITGTHYDLFVGPEGLFRQMNLANRADSEIIVGHPRCSAP